MARLRTFRVTLAAIVFATGAAVAFVAGAGADPTDPYYDTTPPTITCSANPATLWPPNHKLRAVDATVTVTDANPTSYMLELVTSSQPDSGLGKDDVPGDIVGWNTGTNDTSGFLRSERYAGKRTYTLVYRGFDSAGNSAACQIAVTVSMS